MTGSEIKDLNLNEVMQKWEGELAGFVPQFEEAASMVARWDRQILHNGDRVRVLHRDSESLQVAYKELSENLDTVTGQQNELHTMLERLEREVDSKLGKEGGALAANGAVRADVERDKMHRMGVAVMSDLDAMALSIKDLVVDLNKKTAVSNDDSGSSDAVSQIISVLNSHLDSLQYLDETSNQLSRRVNDVAQQCESYARDGRGVNANGRRQNMY